MEVLIHSSADGLNWQTPSLRFRYFVDNNIAARLQFGFGDGMGTPMSLEERFYENADGSGGEGTREVNSMSWNAQIGGEYHFAGTQKFSPYGFAAVNLGVGSRVETWDQADGGSYVEGLTAEIEAGFNRFGLSGGLGMEFYPLENIYIGLELGIGWNRQNFADTEITQSFTTGGTTTTINQVNEGSSRSHLGTTSAIRIGWRF